MTSQPPSNGPSGLSPRPYDIRGHWVNLADLDPDEHTEMIVDYEYFPHDYINCPPSSPRSRRGRTSMTKCRRHCGQRSWHRPMTATVTRTPTACRSQVVSWRPTRVSMSRSMTTSTATSLVTLLKKSIHAPKSCNVTSVGSRISQMPSMTTRFCLLLARATSSSVTSNVTAQPRCRHRSGTVALIRLSSLSSVP